MKKGQADALQPNHPIRSAKQQLYEKSNKSNFQSLHPAVSNESMLSSSPKKVEVLNNIGQSPFSIPKGFTPAASPDLLDLCSSFDDNWNDKNLTDDINNWDSAFFPDDLLYL